MDPKTALLAVIERNQSEILRRLEVIEHKLGIEKYGHSMVRSPRLVRRLGDYCPTVVEEYDYGDESCYLCGKNGTNMSYEEHYKAFGKLATCKRHSGGQEENNDSAESSDESKESNTTTIEGDKP